MYNLKNFSLSEIVACGSAIRATEHQGQSIEDLATRIVRHMFENCVDPQTGEKDIALVRLFKTHSFRHLDNELKEIAQQGPLGKELKDSSKCLVLMATTDVEPEWNTRHASIGHKVIPLVSEHAVPEFRCLADCSSSLAWS